jgi:carbon storage regulator
MLVLSRKAGERIVIGGNICITVVGINGNRVRLGIEAPREVPVNRQEIEQRYLEFAEKLVEPEPHLV